MRKSSPALVPKAPAADTLKAEVDEFGAILAEKDAWDAKFAAKLSRLKILRQQLLDRYQHVPPDEAITAEGKRYILTISMREQERKIISMSELFNSLGRAKFLLHCRFPLAACDSLHVNRALIRSERTGPRTVDAVAKASGTGGSVSDAA